MGLPHAASSPIGPSPRNSGLGTISSIHRARLSLVLGDRGQHHGLRPRGGPLDGLPAGGAPLNVILLVVAAVAEVQQAEVGFDPPSPARSVPV